MVWMKEIRRLSACRPLVGALERPTANADCSPPGRPVQMLFIVNNCCRLCVCFFSFIIIIIVLFAPSSKVGIFTIRFCFYGQTFGGVTSIHIYMYTKVSPRKCLYLLLHWFQVTISVKRKPNDLRRATVWAPGSVFLSFGHRQSSQTCPLIKKNQQHKKHIHISWATDKQLKCRTTF